MEGAFSCCLLFSTNEWTSYESEYYEIVVRVYFFMPCGETPLDMPVCPCCLSGTRLGRNVDCGISWLSSYCTKKRLTSHLLIFRELNRPYDLGIVDDPSLVYHIDLVNTRKKISYMLRAPMYGHK